MALRGLGLSFDDPELQKSECFLFGRHTSSRKRLEPSRLPPVTNSIPAIQYDKYAQIIIGLFRSLIVSRNSAGLHPDMRHYFYLPLIIDSASPCFDIRRLD